VTANDTLFTQRQWAARAVDTTPAPDAIDFIRTEARKRPGEITLIALAPLSNIEALAARDPEAPRDLRQVALMGGSIYADTTKEERSRVRCPGQVVSPRCNATEVR
jgi:inosine-uridine nucleoside N-ribohydrolase